MPITAKLGKMEVYSKGPLSIESFDTLNMWSSYHVTDEKRCISTFVRSVDTKLERVVGFNASLLPSKSPDMLLMWSHKVA